MGKPCYICGGYGGNAAICELCNCCREDYEEDFCRAGDDCATCGLAAVHDETCENCGAHSENYELRHGRECCCDSCINDIGY